MIEVPPPAQLHQVSAHHDHVRQLTLFRKSHAPVHSTAGITAEAPHADRLGLGFKGVQPRRHTMSLDIDRPDGADREVLLTRASLPMPSPFTGAGVIRSCSHQSARGVMACDPRAALPLAPLVETMSVLTARDAAGPHSHLGRNSLQQRLTRRTTEEVLPTLPSLAEAPNEAPTERGPTGTTADEVEARQR